MITDALAYHPGAVTESKESEYLCYVLMRKNATAKPGARGCPMCFRRNKQTVSPPGTVSPGRFPPGKLTRSHARNGRESGFNKTRGVF